MLINADANFSYFNIVELLIYSPNRPVVDCYSAVFLWMMSVGTIVTATLWSEILGSEEHDESRNELSPKVLCKGHLSLYIKYSFKLWSNLFFYY